MMALESAVSDLRYIKEARLLGKMVRSAVEVVYCNHLLIYSPGADDPFICIDRVFTEAASIIRKKYSPVPSGLNVTELENELLAHLRSKVSEVSARSSSLRFDLWEDCLGSHASQHGAGGYASVYAEAVRSALRTVLREKHLSAPQRPGELRSLKKKISIAYGSGVADMIERLYRMNSKLSENESRLKDILSLNKFLNIYDKERLEWLAEHGKSALEENIEMYKSFQKEHESIVLFEDMYCLMQSVSRLSEGVARKVAGTIDMLSIVTFHNFLDQDDDGGKKNGVHSPVIGVNKLVEDCLLPLKRSYSREYSLWCEKLEHCFNKDKVLGSKDGRPAKLRKAASDLVKVFQVCLEFRKREYLSCQSEAGYVLCYANIYLLKAYILKKIEFIFGGSLLESPEVFLSDKNQPFLVDLWSGEESPDYARVMKKFESLRDLCDKRNAYCSDKMDEIQSKICRLELELERENMQMNISALKKNINTVEWALRGLVRGTGQEDGVNDLYPLSEQCVYNTLKMKATKRGDERFTPESLVRALHAKGAYEDYFYYVHSMISMLIKTKGFLSIFSRFRACLCVERTAAGRVVAYEDLDHGVSKKIGPSDNQLNSPGIEEVNQVRSTCSTGESQVTPSDEGPMQDKVCDGIRGPTLFGIASGGSKESSFSSNTPVTAGGDSQEVLGKDRAAAGSPANKNPDLPPPPVPLQFVAAGTDSRGLNVASNSSGVGQAQKDERKRSRDGGNASMGGVSKKCKAGAGKPVRRLVKAQRRGTSSGGQGQGVFAGAVHRSPAKSVLTAGGKKQKVQLSL